MGTGYNYIGPIRDALWRVHPVPEALPRIDYEGPGRNRFDDPLHAVPVRYAARTLRGCLVETMARWRPDPVTEAALASVVGLDVGDVDHADPVEGLAVWLAEQRVGRLVLPEETRLVDVEDAGLLVAMDKHPLVRDALDRSGLGTKLSPVHLDAALVRLGGPVGRPITQALSRAVREWVPEVDGLLYHSRLDPHEQCVALWGYVDVEIAAELLTPEKASHVEAVQSVARLFEITLPSAWA